MSRGVGDRCVGSQARDEIAVFAQAVQQLQLGEELRGRIGRSDEAVVARLTGDHGLLRRDFEGSQVGGTNTLRRNANVIGNDGIVEVREDGVDQTANQVLQRIALGDAAPVRIVRDLPQRRAMPELDDLAPTHQHGMQIEGAVGDEHAAGAQDGPHASHRHQCGCSESILLEGNQHVGRSRHKQRIDLGMLLLQIEYQVLGVVGEVVAQSRSENEEISPFG